MLVFIGATNPGNFGRNLLAQGRRPGCARYRQPACPVRADQRLRCGGKAVNVAFIALIAVLVLYAVLEG